MNARRGWCVVLACSITVLTPGLVEAKRKPGGTFGQLSDASVKVGAVTARGAWDPESKSGSWSDAQPVSNGPVWEYRETLGCGSTTDPDAATDLSSCSLAISRCGTVGGKPVNQLYVWRRLAGTSQWFFDGTSCGSPNLPNTVSAPPPVPTMGQIVSAFRELPFAKPTVNIQPEGDVTLVNLPTYFEAQWPTSGLRPGQVSKPVQLLSWSVEFKIDPASYNYSFGDGTQSGWTDDPGGPYPDGQVRHTYKDSGQGEVKVDATLTASYRVNGGEWIELDGVADLQDEPVTTITVREAKARLYGNG